MGARRTGLVASTVTAVFVVTGCAAPLASVAARPDPAPHLMLAQAVTTPVPAPSSAATAPVPAQPAPPDERPPSPEPGPAPPSSVSSDKALREHEASATTRYAGWVLVGIGASAGVLALTTSAAMLNDLSTRNANCNASKVCNASGAAANGELANFGGWNLASWIVAGVGLGVGAYLVLANPSTQSQSASNPGPAIGIATTGSGAGLSLRSGF